MSTGTMIGLLGGGQLGRMLCEAAGPLGIDIAVLDAVDAPAKRALHNDHHVNGSFKDAAKIRELAARSDYLTVEIEHVETQVLEDIAQNGVQLELDNGKAYTHKPPIHPGPRTLRLIQDKYLQKEHFKQSTRPDGETIPVATQLAIDGGENAFESLRRAAEQFDYPFMLKARTGSYDGRGNFKIAGPEDLEPALQALGKLPLYAEKWAPFDLELAVMVIRTEDDDGNLENCVPYPAVETVHEDSVCTKVFLPPRNVPDETCEKAQALACDAVRTLWGRGVFAVEMFVFKNGSLMVNEVAPRPHNSGHYTIEAVPQMSQFKAQLHAVLDLDIPQTIIPRVKSAIMINILGGADQTSHHGLCKLARTTFHDRMDVHLHMYGKESKPGRKIGHITLTGHCPLQELQELAKPFTAEADKIRAKRLASAAEQLRPQGETGEKKGDADGMEEANDDDVQTNLDIASLKNAANGPVEKQESAEGAKLASMRRQSTNNRSESAEPFEQNTRRALARQTSTLASLDRLPSDPLVLVTMGSDSDLPVLKAGLDILEEFRVPYAVRITSAHRTPKLMMHVAEEAASQGIKVIIAAAGGAAHLPGMVSSETPLPVIGVPVKASQMGGLDSLLSIVQMPRGIPTATVGINNSTNAALLAVRILGTSISKYMSRMEQYQQRMEDDVVEKNNQIKKLGGLAYLESMKGFGK